MGIPLTLLSPSLARWVVHQDSCVVLHFSHFSLVFLDDLSRVDTRHRTEMRKRAEARTHHARTPRNARSLARRDKKESGDGGGDAMVKEKATERKE